MKKVLIGIAGVIVLLGLWVMGSYNTLVSTREDVRTSWSQVQNVYQRRADLIPNLVNTVKGFAKQEKEVLVGVTEARAKVGQINLKSDDLTRPGALGAFQKAQDSLSSALSRLMVVVEKYPELKSNENFLALQSQLEGTENRITVERQRFNDSANGYNKKLLMLPGSLVARIFHFEKFEYFQAKAGSETAPVVEF